jgi:hypothetical protein
VANISPWTGALLRGTSPRPPFALLDFDARIAGRGPNIAASGNMRVDKEFPHRKLTSEDGGGYFVGVAEGPLAAPV